jgi:hypothetical protein
MKGKCKMKAKQKTFSMNATVSIFTFYIFHFTFNPPASRACSLLPPFALKQKVEPKIQGCQKPAKNARFRLKKNKSQR